MVRVSKQKLEQYGTDLFMAAGLKEEEAKTIARHLVLANLRGVDSHGISRVEIYTTRIKNGTISSGLNYDIIKQTPISAYIDGQNSSGILLTTKATEIAIEKAKTTGIGIVGVKNSSHGGMLADYTMQITDNDLIGFASTNAPANMAPWGGKERFFGTNPFSYGVPAGEEINIVFDMATSLVARGKIILAKKNNQNIPLGWALTLDGKPTTDPDEALKGIVLPVGGPKGYGIAFLVEVLSAIFTGAAFGPQIGDLYTELNKVQNTGQFVMAMRADLFVELDEFKQRMDQMIREIRKNPLAEGFDRIYLPGEIELERTKEREVNGVPISEEVIEELIQVGKRFGLSENFN